jgi:hypothetical protein
MTNFGRQFGMVQLPKSLTDGGRNAYKQSNTSLGAWQTSAAELFRQNE